MKQHQQWSKQMTKFIVCATCSIKGSSLYGVEAKIWYGNTLAAAKRVLARKQEEYGSMYSNWRIVEKESRIIQ